MRFGRLIKKLCSLSLAPIHRSFSNSFRDTTAQSVRLLEKIPFNELKGKVFYYKMVPVADRDEAQRFAAIGAALVVRSLHSEDGVYGYYDNDSISNSDYWSDDNEEQKRKKVDDFDDAVFIYSIISESKETQSPKEDDESSSDEFDFEKADQLRIEQEQDSQHNQATTFYDSSREPHPVWKKDVKTSFEGENVIIPPVKRILPRGYDDSFGQSPDRYDGGGYVSSSGGGGYVSSSGGVGYVSSSDGGGSFDFSNSGGGGGDYGGDGEGGSWDD